MEVREYWPDASGDASLHHSLILRSPSTRAWPAIAWLMAQPSRWSDVASITVQPDHVELTIAVRKRSGDMGADIAVQQHEIFEAWQEAIAYRYELRVVGAS